MAVGEIGLVVRFVVRLPISSPAFPAIPFTSNARMSSGGGRDGSRARPHPPHRGVRIVWVDVRRPDDVGKAHSTEWRVPRVARASNLIRWPRTRGGRSNAGKG